MGAGKPTGKRKPPPFGMIPGYDFEPLQEAIDSQRILPVVDELLTLFEEGHSSALVAEWLIETSIPERPAPSAKHGEWLPHSIPALNAALTIQDRLPYEETILSIMQAASIVLSETKASNSDPEESEPHSELRSILLNRWKQEHNWFPIIEALRSAGRAAGFALCDWYLYNLDRFEFFTNSELVPDLIEHAIDLIETNRQTIQRDIPFPVVDNPRFTDFGAAERYIEPQIDQWISRLRFGKPDDPYPSGIPDTGILLAAAKIAVSRHIIELNDDQDIVRLVELIYQLEAAQWAVRRSFAIDVPELLENVNRVLSSIPTNVEANALMTSDELHLSDLPILVEGSKADGSKRWIRTWLHAGGNHEPVWGVLSRCAVRVDATSQFAMSLTTIPIMHRWYRLMPDVAEKSDILVAAGALEAYLPKTYSIIHRVQDDEE